MNKENNKGYSIGFKKPPRHTQFQPGRSGNPSGRPKKTEALPDVLQKELNARITIMKDGKRRRISILRAILKQHLTLAVKGDSKAFNNVLKAVKAHRPDSGDNLATLVHEFRALNAQHMGLDQGKRRVNEAADLSETLWAPRKKKQEK
jgi:hypothetical protein